MSQAAHTSHGPAASSSLAEQETSRPLQGCSAPNHSPDIMTVLTHLHLVHTPLQLDMILQLIPLLSVFLLSLPYSPAFTSPFSYFSFCLALSLFLSSVFLPHSLYPSIPLSVLLSLFFHFPLSLFHTLSFHSLYVFLNPTFSLSPSLQLSARLRNSQW